MRQLIRWICEDVDMPAIDRLRLEAWIAKVAASHGYTLGKINYIFCNDEGIIKVNRQFLNHDFYTDVITFDYTYGDVVSGDIYISLDTVASNAVLVNADYDTELKRVIIHGVLHLCGIDDKGPGEREIMESHEDAALAMLEAKI